MQQNKNTTTIQKTFQFRLKPNKQQRIAFAQFSGTRRFIYNYGLGRVKNALENKQKIPTYVDICNELPKLKKSPETNWLKETHSQVLQQALKDLERTTKRFFHGLKKKRKLVFQNLKKRDLKILFGIPKVSSVIIVVSICQR